MSTHASRTSTDAMRRDLLPALLATAARIEADLRIVASDEPRRRVLSARPPALGVAPPTARRARAGAERARAPATALAVVLLALNLRPVFAGLPPLVADVRADLGLSGAAAGLLTTLPGAVHRARSRRSRRGCAARVPIERLLVACALLTAARAPGCAGVGTTAALFAAGRDRRASRSRSRQALLPVLIRDALPAADSGC